MPGDASCLEICVDTVEDFERARRAGAQRIELCARLDLGGTTPEDALLAHAAESELPCVAMLRARGGGFCYDAEDRRALLRDAERLRGYEVDAWISGALDASGALDLVLLRELRAASGDRLRVFHRAFDHLAEHARPAALESLRELGFTRVLTAGHPEGVPHGLAALERLASPRPEGLTILVGGGLKPTHIPQLWRRGYREFHASARAGAPPRVDPVLVQRFLAQIA